MADETEDDLLMRDLIALGEPQRQPETYQPIGPRLDAPMRRPDAGQFGRDLMLQDQENDKLMREFLSLGKSEQPGREIAVTRPELFQSGDRLIDEQVAKHAIGRREAADRARDQSSSALFGDWDKLDDKSKKEWASSEKAWADGLEWFWTGIKGRLDERCAATKGVPYSDLEGDPFADFLERKLTENIGLAKHRRAVAEAIEKGEAEGPKFGAARTRTEDVLRGASRIPGLFLKGLTYGAAYIAGEPMSKAQEATLYKIGDLAEEWGKALFPADAVRQHEFAGQFAEGAGSMAAFMGPSIAARLIFGAGPLTMTAISGVTGAGAQSGSMTDDTLKAMAAGKTVDGRAVTEDDAAAAFLWGVPIGASEAFPLASLFRGHQGQWVRRILMQAAEEGGQEFGQQIAENIVARSHSDDKRVWDDNAWTGMAVETWAGVRREKA